MSIQEQIEIMMAYDAGKQIQVANKGSNNWTTMADALWNWVNFDYRIKPEEIKPLLMTYRQLSEWLSKGYGEYGEGGCSFCYTRCSYFLKDANKEVPYFFHIRPWGSEEWVLPTYDIYERDCKEASK